MSEQTGVSGKCGVPGVTTGILGAVMAMTDDRPRGFGGLHCPACGEDGACITLDLDDCAVFHCRECEAELSVEDVKEFVAKADAWRRVLAWVATAPVRQE